MHKIIASLLAVVVTTLSIAIMAALVDDSKLTAQQVGQYRVENFVVVDDLIKIPETTRIFTRICFRLKNYDYHLRFIDSHPQTSFLLAEQVKLVDLAKINNQIKKSLTI
ncbi:hypothetical protein MHM98_08070 [Psychrobium sp. MM17-31]|uniref:hypothetical protein n=1 Tax=Psychrobium sp. MM17-31 TaxID=2917758 RepID=UPI001EF6E314|nr:hypothetical protein [Psychrobium sp. MM17-31]MCG7531303.1 hypothetical protein [Psychrobium sp. MM17-31]